MKYNNSYFMQLPRTVCDEEHVKNLSIGARMLYVTLNELEQRYCTAERNHFLRSDLELANDMGVSLNTLKKYKRELKNNGTDLVRIRKGHWINEHGKLSEQSYTSYTIL